MKILQVAETCSGGVGRHVRSLCKGLVARGHQLTLAYSPYRTDEAFRQFVTDQRDEIKLISLEVGRTISLTSDLQSIIKLMRFIKSEGQFDVIHGHSSKGGAIARITGRLSQIPTVYTPNGLVMSSPEFSRLEAAVFTMIERILGHLATSRFIVVSEDERELVRGLRLVPRKRITLVQNAIDDEDFENLSGEDLVGSSLDEKPLVFGSTMRFTPEKAPGLLVEAFVRLSEALPQVPMQLMIAGDGKLFDETKEQVEASGVSHKISLLGWRSNVGALLREFDIFVLSSLYEGLSYSLLEAMAAKLPIVSTSVPGMRETISRVPGNVLVPVGDPEALAQGMRKIATVAESESLRQSLQRIGQANHDYVRVRFRQSDATRRTLEVYRCLR